MTTPWYRNDRSDDEDPLMFKDQHTNSATPQQPNASVSTERMHMLLRSCALALNPNSDSRRSMTIHYCDPVVGTGFSHKEGRICGQVHAATLHHHCDGARD